MNQIFNPVVEKMMPQVKEKEDCINYRIEFLWNFLQVSFQCGVPDQCPIGSVYWTIVGDTHSDIVTLFLIHFNRSHSCIHIKGGCITVCENMVVTECVK